MIISICIPCHNRTYDLEKVMPSLIVAANVSPPVEIAILDYGSQDDLGPYMDSLMDEPRFVGGSSIKYTKYDAEYYHMAHARNLSVLASSGEFIVISSTDVILEKNYFKVVREILEEGDYAWLHHHRRFIGVLGCSRNEFINAGGFDERFEFYGKEDKDLVLRLKRRGKKFRQMPLKLLDLIPTPKEEKFKNYRLCLSRKELKKRSVSLYEENIRNEVLVANKEGWGKWQ